MEIPRSQFPLDLVNIIKEIADSHFVAFDLEFSGIAGRVFRQGGRSLQQAYEEARDAANRYQVLQFGMTIATEDRERGELVNHPIAVKDLLDSRIAPFSVYDLQSKILRRRLTSNSH